MYIFKEKFLVMKSITQGGQMMKLVLEKLLLLRLSFEDDI